MTLIAFDVSKNELVGVRVNRAATIEEEFLLPNTPLAISSFLQEASSRHPRLTVASEATAEYHRPLALACLAQQIPFRLLNPLITKQLTRVTVRKKKTDLSDAYLIAKAVLQGGGTMVSYATFDPLKIVMRTAVRIGELSGALLRIERHIAATVPEQQQTLASVTKLRFHAETTVQTIRRVAEQEVDSVLRDLLASIPGIGPTLATTFITELEPLCRFPNGKSLVAYAGLDPKVKQSGVSMKRNTHLTKRGSPTLRRAAYIAASIAQRVDADLKTHYEKKRGEGKRYREATIANARHILYRVFAVWKRGTPYVKRRLSTATT